MSERKFSNRRRPQRFKPTSGGGGSGRGKDGDRRSEGGGGNAKSRRQAQNARALATGEKSGEEKVFNASRVRKQAISRNDGSSGTSNEDSEYHLGPGERIEEWHFFFEQSECRYKGY